MKIRNNSLRIISYIVASFAPALALAQTDETPELSKTIYVHSEYKPQISDAVRISVNPSISDSLDLQVNLNYKIATSPVNTDYHIIPLKAVSVKGDKLNELYRGELTAGLGNHWNSLFSFRYMTERSRKKQSGIEMFHSGSAGKITLANDDRVQAGYSHDYVKFYWKRFFENFTLSTSVQPKYRADLCYGYGENAGISGVGFNRNDVRRNVFGAAANVGINSTKTDEEAIRYKANVAYNLAYSLPENMENYADFSGELEKRFGRVVVGLNADYEMNILNFSPLDDTLGKFQSVLNANPYAKVSAENWNLKVGLKASPAMGGISYFRIVPDIAFSYAIPKLKMIPYIQVGGGVDLITMDEMLIENPYVIDNFMLRPTVNLFGLDFGVNGRLQKLITYNAGVALNAFNDMYFWHAMPNVNVGQFEKLDVTDFSNVPTKFAADFDKGSVFKIHGDMGFLFRKMNFGIDANYYYWTTDSLAEAWYKPFFDFTISPRFDVINPVSNKSKLTVEPKLYVMTFKKPTDLTQTTAENAAIVDFAVEANYFYNSVLRIFFTMNNILCQTNERYVDYPMQKANFLLGLSFSFGGHK